MSQAKLLTQIAGQHTMLEFFSKASSHLKATATTPAPINFVSEDSQVQKDSQGQEDNQGQDEQTWGEEAE